MPSYDTKVDDAKGYSSFTSLQIARTEIALNYISGVINVQFQKTTTASQLNTITFASNVQIDSAGYAYYPSDSFLGSDVFLNDDVDNKTLADGKYGALTLIHELGHALGLEHTLSKATSTGQTSDPPYLSAIEDTTKWTVMSYNDSVDQYLLQYSELDIAALQYIYGPSTNARTGNDTYKLSSTTPNLIWDGQGIDTIDGSSINQPITLYLTPGEWGYIGSSRATYITSPGQITVNFGTVIENAIGGSGNDKLVGNTADNSLSGGAGNDLFIATLGTDTIDGGVDTDTILFSGIYSTYTLSAGSNGTINVSSASLCSDAISNVERFKFKDIWYANDTNANNAAQVIYAAFGKNYVKQFLSTGISLADSGISLNGLCEMVTNNHLVESISGLNTTKGYVDTLFNNVVGRIPTALEELSFTSQIDSGGMTKLGLLELAAAYSLTVSDVNALKVNLIGIPFEPAL